MQRPGALKHLPWLAMLLALPTLWLPFMLDDTFHRLALEGWLSGEAAHPYFDGWVDPYGLPSCFRFFEPGRGEHFMPWWTDPDLTIRFWRPLSSLDALVDHVAFGDRAWAWHLHSVLWYGVLVAAACSVYRLALGPVALVAAGLFAVDETHFLPVAWIANRNAIIAGALGLFGLSAHLRWRSGSSKHGVLAPLLLTAGLLGGEAALGVFGYIGAYELHRWRRQGPSWHILPALLVGLGWAAHYKVQGFGSVGSGNYLDPTAQPLEYLAEVAVRLPMLVQAQFLGIPSDLGLFVPFSAPILTALGAVVLLGLGLGWRPLLAAVSPEEGEALRWMVPGAFLALFPVMATFPIDRLLLIPGLGFSVVTAAVLRVAWQRGRGWVPIGGIHVVLPALMWLVGAGFYGTLLRQNADIIRSTPIAPEVADRKALVLVASDPTVGIYLPMELHWEGRDMPMTWQILSMVKADHILRGTSTGWSLEATSHRMLTQVFELLFRSPRHRPFEVGQTSSNQGLTVTVSALRDGTPYAVDFVLDRPADWAFLVWSEAGLVEVDKPAPGEAVDLPWSPGPMGI